ncbi:hypothetical protein D3C84_580960 [compost metagenome]
MERRLARGLPVIAEGVGVLGIALEHRKTGAGAIAFVVEVFVGTAVAEKAASARHQAQAEAQLRAFGVAKAVVGEGERRVLERHLVAVTGEIQLLVEVLEVDAGRQRVGPVATGRQRVDRRHAVGMTLAQHVAAADGRDVAVGLVTGKLHAPALAERRGVGTGPDLGVGGVLGRGKERQRHAVAQLPQVVVAEAGDTAQLFGVGAVVVVQAQTGLPRVLVFNLQVDVHGPWALTFAHQRHDLATGVLVQFCQFSLHLGEVRHLAFFQRRYVVANFHRRIVLGADDTNPANLGFADLQINDAVLDLLLRQLHEHRLIAVGLIRLLQRIAGTFDIGQVFLRTEKRIHRLFDRTGIEHGVAAHEVFVDVDRPGFRRLDTLLRPCRLYARRHQQPAPQRQP